MIISSTYFSGVIWLINRPDPVNELSTVLEVFLFIGSATLYVEVNSSKTVGGVP